MGVAPEGMRHIIDRLTDLSDNPPQYAVREAISNAMDATMELPPEERKPVEVSTPSILANTFVVTDHGIGMSPDTVRTITSQYGATTKIRNFAAVGAYGLGFKAPLAYCNEFSVSTTQDGVTTDFIVSRAAEGNETEIISIAHTGKPSGTTITIPVRTEDAVLFERALDPYRKFQADVPLIVDGKLIETSNEFVLFDTFLLDEDTNTMGRVWANQHYLNSGFSELITNGEINSQIHMVLSGWLYSNVTKTNHYYTESAVILEIFPGVVDFASSRDYVTDNDRLRAIVDRMKGKFFTFNDELVDRLSESYKAFSKKEAYDFCQQLLLLGTVQNTNVVFQRRGYYNSKTPDRKIAVKLFTTDEGYNPFLSIQKKGDEVFALAALEWNEHYRPDYSVASLHAEDGRGMLKKSKNPNQNRVGAHSDFLLKIVEEKDTFPFKQFIYSHMGMAYTSKPKKAAYTIFTGVDTEFAELFVKHRALLNRYVYKSASILFCSTTPTKADLEEIKEVFGVIIDVVDRAKFDEVVEEAKVLRREEAKTKKTKDLPFVTIRVMEKVPSHSEVVIYHSRSYNYAASLSLEDEMAKNSYIFVGGKTHPSSAIYGAVNSGVDLVGKRVAVVESSTMLAAHFTALQDYDKVYVDSDAVIRSKAAEALRAEKLKRGTAFLSDLKKVTRSQAIAAALSVYGVSYGINWENLRGIAQHAEEGSDLRAYLKLAQEGQGVSAPYAIRYNVSDDLFKLHLTDEERRVLKQYSELLHWYQSRRYYDTLEDNVTFSVISHGQGKASDETYTTLSTLVLPNLEERMATKLKEEQEAAEAEKTE